MLNPNKAVPAVPTLLLISLLGACSSNNETADTLIHNQAEPGSELEAVIDETVPELGAAVADTPATTDNSAQTTDNVDDTASAEAATAVAAPAENVDTDAVATGVVNAESADSNSTELAAGADAETTDTTAGNPDEVTASDLVDPPAAATETPAVLNDATYESASTEGFSARVSGNNVEVQWAAAPSARGYNVYRDGEYLTTVSEAAFSDINLSPASYYYEIDAFDNNDNFDLIADALTVYVGVPNLDGPNQEHPLPEHIVEDYQLVFSEEFEGNTLDTTKWNTSYLWGTDLFINQEEQYYVDTKNDANFGYDPFNVNDGLLTIEAIRTPDNLRDKALGQSYLSGVITSYDSFQFTYGYVEARARLPYSKGLWSAFWLLNAYYVERKPEIDIMEHIGDYRDVAYHTYHYYDQNGDLHSTEALETDGIDFTSQFHTFGVEWLPGKIIFYVDGKPTQTVTDSKVSSQSMYIIANTALGGWWPGSPDETTQFPTKYEIDYIRAYQKPGVQLDAGLLDDGEQTVPLADTVNSPPNRIPSPEQWPEGYPELQR